MATSRETSLHSRTILWCVPRSISTAITKCLTAIEDIQIWYEPYRFCEFFAKRWHQMYNTDVPLDFKSNEDVYQRVIDRLAEISYIHYKQEHISYASLKRLLETASTSASRIFVKDLAFHTDKPYSSLLPDGYKHTFLIRHPLRSINSYRKSNYNSLLDKGMLKGLAAEEKTFDLERDNPTLNFSYFHENQYVIWNYVRQNIDSHPIVMDSDDFLANPAEMLSKYCRAIGLPYAESLLKWDASADAMKNWNVPADDLFEGEGHFFDTAIKSSEFFASSEMPSRDDVTPDVIRYTDRVLEYYEEMYANRIRLDIDSNA